MKIETIRSINIDKNKFLGNKRRQNTDRAATVQDLYELEDRMNAKYANLLKKQKNILAQLITFDDLYELKNKINSENENLINNQSKMIGQSLNDLSKLIYMRQTASAHDYYVKAKASSEALKNNQ